MRWKNYNEHMAVRVPMFSDGEYFNYEHAFNVILITVFGVNYCFCYIDIKTQRRHSDGGVYDHCSFK